MSPRIKHVPMTITTTITHPSTTTTTTTASTITSTTTTTTTTTTTVKETTTFMSSTELIDVSTKLFEHINDMIISTTEPTFEESNYTNENVSSSSSSSTFASIPLTRINIEDITSTGSEVVNKTINNKEEKINFTTTTTQESSTNFPRLFHLLANLTESKTTAQIMNSTLINNATTTSKNFSWI